jgi:tyrosinase
VFDSVSGFGGDGKKTSFAELLGFQGTSKPAQTGHGHTNSPIETLLSSFSTGGGCLLNGPFKNRTLRIGPFARMAPNNTRCMTRNFNARIAEVSASKKTLSRILSAKSFDEFSDRISHPPPFPTQVTIADLFNLPGDLHSIGHGGVGGEVSFVNTINEGDANNYFKMMDPFNSVNDPLFFMHHGALDQLWALWQEQDPKRIYDFSASKLEKEPLRPDTPLNMGVFGPEKLAKEVSDTQNRDGTGILCFRYEGLDIEKYML